MPVLPVCAWDLLSQFALRVKKEAEEPRKERKFPSKSVERRFNTQKPRKPLTNSERAEILERAGRQE